MLYQFHGGFDFLIPTTHQRLANSQRVTLPERVVTLNVTLKNLHKWLFLNDM